MGAPFLVLLIKKAHNGAYTPLCAHILCFKPQGVKLSHFLFLLYHKDKVLSTEK
jgi:hypothetical protein